MTRIHYRIATQKDIDFIALVDEKNMAALHGAPRSWETWQALLADPHTIYYIVYNDEPAGWFRMDEEEDGMWLGILQISPFHQRQGIGRAVVAEAERLARQQGYHSLGIHATEDNAPALALYAACGYAVTEIGPCTTADGVERIGVTLCKNL